MGAHDVTRCSFFLGGTRVEVVKKGVQMNETRWRQLGRRDEKKQKKKRNSAGRAEGRQDGFANPYQRHSLWWSNFDLHRG